ncbi:MAG TPA: DUF2868 domain-containing protein [Marinobacter sp.]|nr:DUF2868 domain-containing protein [Marinobacter sp.]
MSQHPLRLLLDFDERIRHDKDQAPAFLHRRDRRFALDCQAEGLRPGPGRWLEHMDRLSGPGGRHQPGREAQQHWRHVNSGFAAAGAVFGAITMAGLLFYEGGQRINLTVILAFVLLQLVLALATTVQSIIGWQPWRWLQRRLQSRPPGPTLARLQPLLMARAAHIGGTLFALAGLATLLVLLLVQDLAFGWSTTLTTASESFHRLMMTFARPWSWLWPAAVPSLELVEATRFFRAAPDPVGVAPARWGQWWPYVMMLWLTWVVVPRLLLLALSQWLLKQKARWLLRRHPGLKALQYRMATPTVDTGNQHHDAADMPDTRTRSGLGQLTSYRYLICWAGAGEPELPAFLETQGNHRFKAGGQASLAEDDHVVNELAGHLATAQAPSVVVLTRSWEPPTGELYDFLSLARQRWPARSTVVLLPLATDPGQAPLAQHLQPWLRFTERLPAGFASVALGPDVPGPSVRYRSQES